MNAYLSEIYLRTVRVRGGIIVLELFASHDLCGSSRVMYQHVCPLERVSGVFELCT